MNVDLKLSNAELASQIRELGDFQHIPADLRKEINKLDPAERDIVEAFIDWKKDGTDASYNDFVKTIRDAMKNESAPGYCNNYQILLDGDPKYQRMEWELQAAHDLLSVIDLVDRENMGAHEGTIDRNNILWSMDHSPDPHVREVCRKIVDNPELFGRLDPEKNDLINRDSLALLVQDMAANIEAYKDQAQVRAMANRPATEGQRSPPTQSSQSGATGGQQPTPPTDETPPQSGPKNEPTAPTPSRELTGNTIDERTESLRRGLFQELTDARKELQDAINSKDQAKVQAAQEKIQDISNALQTIMQMQQLIMTMFQNISKMMHEMSMAAIRNIR